MQVDEAIKREFQLELLIATIVACLMKEMYFVSDVCRVLIFETWDLRTLPYLTDVCFELLLPTVIQLREKMTIPQNAERKKTTSE